MNSSRRHPATILLAVALLSVFGTPAVHAQVITPDTDTGTLITNPVTNPNQFDISGGIRAGANLFHSFQQFGLAPGQTANFLSQPTIQNILGRVTGGNASLIHGLIQVTGGTTNLFLINPAGIIFGPQARLNVPAAFTATTANGLGIGMGWFNATGPNHYASLTANPDSFAFLSHPGAILNAGVLTTQPGQRIALLGGTVVNTGTISAPGGTITIAAVPGQWLVRISQAGSLLSLLLPTETAAAINTPTTIPLSLPALLTGGTVPEATGLSSENGQLRLVSTGAIVPTEPGGATVSGSLSTATSALPLPSQIQVVGDRVALLSATLDASGMTGGSVRIGGDFQGTGTLLQARFTAVDAQTVIRADTQGRGNGGTVVVWSMDTTQVAGTLTAQGGDRGGNGGLVETSGQRSLLIAPSARVSTYAPLGAMGTWLLDTPELTVGATGTANLTGTPLTNTPTTAATISAGAIGLGLSTSHVNLQADNWITVNAPIVAPTAWGNLTFTTPTVTLNEPITLAASNTLNGTASTVDVNAGAIIQNGVDVAASGGTVHVAAGIFYVLGQRPQVSLTKPLTVQGAGAGNTIIDGGYGSRGVYVDPGAGNTVNLDGLTIQHGSVAANGAGIWVNSGTLNLSNSMITGNLANLGSGGGIVNSGTLYLSNSTITGNSANLGSGGGGIANSGTLYLNNSTITSNSASYGGGIFNDDAGTLYLSNSMIRGNSASYGGGGIANDGTLYLSNSTITGNSGFYSSGGGIFNDGTLYLSNSTITGNSGFRGGGGGIYNSGITQMSNSTITNNSANSGGGVFNAAQLRIPIPAFLSGARIQVLSGDTPSTTAFTVRNSIIAGNMAVSGPEVTNLGISTSDGYNLFGVSGFSGVDGITLHPTDIVPSVPITQILAPLGNYGGPTPTHALVPNSPAIDRGDPNLLTPDQRGVARVGRADIGAFEFWFIPLPAVPLPAVQRPSFTLPAFTLEELNQISAALLGQELEPMTATLQPVSEAPLFCAGQGQDGTSPESQRYPGIPVCHP